MDKKDIALSVGGIIATMALAYLFYRQQQNQAAQQAAAAQNDQYTGLQQQLDQASELTSLESMFGGSSSTVASSDVTSAATTSTDSAASSTSSATNDANSLISSIISDFLPSSGTTITMPVDAQAQVLANIPTSAGAALDGVGVTTITSNPNGSTTTTGAQIPVAKSGSTTNPVIMVTGAS